jgi:hypothetical protein
MDDGHHLRTLDHVLSARALLATGEQSASAMLAWVKGVAVTDA